VEPDDHTVFLSNAGEPFCLDHLSDLVRTHVDGANIRTPDPLPIISA
jgi:integrase/recombinase XerD